MNIISSSLFHSRHSSAALQRRSTAGFSLIELLTVLVVAAILASIAAPSLTGMIASQRTKSVATNLHLALTIARSEATKRNANVTMAANAGGWANGWVIFPTDTPANILQNYAATKNVAISATTTGGAATTTVVYQSSGRVKETATFVVTVAGQSSASRCTSVGLSGRPYVKAGTSC